MDKAVKRFSSHAEAEAANKAFYASLTIEDRLKILTQLLNDTYGTEHRLNEFPQLLESFNVKYLIVGAIAKSLVGEPRTTGDIDFWVSNDRDNADKMLKVVAEFGFGSLGLTLDDFLKDDIVLQLGYPPRRIDLMTSISGVDFNETWERRTIFQINGLSANVISKEDLIINKLATGRPKDLADVVELT